MIVVEPRNETQKVIMRCTGCLSTTILILHQFDFKFKEKIGSLSCLYCGLKKYTIHQGDEYSLIGPAHKEVKCEKCSMANVSFLGNDVFFCHDCLRFFTE